MELDILFWLAIGAIYLFQMFAGRNKRKQVPGQPRVETGPSYEQPGGLPGASAETYSETSPGSRQRHQTGSETETAPTLQDALREISDILSGKPVGASGGSSPDAIETTGEHKPKPEAVPDRKVGVEYRSPLEKKTESRAERTKRLAELRKKHRTHRTKPLGGDRSDAPVLDENVFERRARPPRSSTYDDIFESPLYESFGDPIDHKELKVEILDSQTPAVDNLRKDLRLSRDEARRGIILSEILRPPLSKRGKQAGPER